ncbi:protein trapped in endoderm-1-like [Aphidius gifuensis]|uniref:protein trapped in endoderm-1-like n=1 Tax=Aphidius gifuensis TaxID=684658 RepID=UPI001CDD10A0|nr:protein trapped in endoderm-1-like [Aphidius gifuensis]
MSVSLFTLVAIAINRYILIVKPKIHNGIYSPENTSTMIILIWIVSYALLLPMIFGIWGSVGLDKKIMVCEILKNKEIKKSRQKMATYLPTQRAASNQENEITYLMFKIFIGFLACFLPTVLVNIFDSDGNYPVYHLVESMTSCASVVINPIIYVSTNKLFRSGFREIFSCSSHDVIAKAQHHTKTLYRQAQLSSLPPTNSSSENDTSYNPHPSSPSDS